MSDGTEGRADERGTQIRLALVMNGGVSLAVWMGGVTHELDLLRRASGSTTPPSDVAERDRAVFAIWRDLARSRDKDVQIDIVSGTSAGGLNGLFLATAIARGAALPDLRQMWRSSASLDKLLRQPAKPRPKTAGTSAEENSVLNGQYFEKKIGEALRSIGSGTGAGDEVTLFVTATALDGRCRTYRDGYGRSFGVADHRRVYRFESRAREVEYRKQPDGTYKIAGCAREESHFATAAEPLLRLAGRATASFPGAFAPVSEAPLLDRRIMPPDGRQYPASSVMDGGVLNNEPFGSVLEAITKRVASGAVHRVVAYVVPSAGQLAEERAKDVRSSDLSIPTTVWSATNYPKEANFRASVDELEDRLATSGVAGRDELFERLVVSGAGIGGAGGSGPDGTGAGRWDRTDEEPAPPTVAEARGLLREYRRSRLTALLLALRPAAGTATDAVTTLAAPRTPNKEALAGILRRTDWLWCPSDDPAEIENPGKDGQRSWQWGLIVAERVLQTFGNHLQSRLAETPATGKRHNGEDRQERQDGQDGQVIQDAQDRQDPQDPRRSLVDAAKLIDGRLREVIAITEAVKAEEARRRPAGVELSEEQVVRLVDGVFRDMDVSGTTGALVWRAAEDFARALNALGPALAAAGGRTPPPSGPGPEWSAEQVISLALQVEVLTQTFAPPAKVLGKLTPRFEFLRLGPDSLGPLFNEDWSASLGDRKLYGIRFHHFGGFINDEWRKSDFLWGRLDAVHHLLPLLVADGDVLATEKALHRAILEAETGLPADKAVAALRDRLAQLKHRTDAELLDTDDRATVKAAGDSVLRRAVGGQGRLVRQIAASVWAWFWEAWSQGESPRPAQLGHDLARPFRRLAAGAALAYLVLVAGIVALIVLVIVL